MLGTLSAIRDNAPATDRLDPALTPRDQPHWAKARDGTRYVAVSIYPRDNDELRRLCKGFSEAAVIDVQWDCVIVWLMNSPAVADLTNPIQVACVAVGLVRDRDRIRLDWPRHDGEEWRPAFLGALSPDVRQEAELVANETLSDWKRAGQPHMGWRRIKYAYRHLTSCPAFIERYVRPVNSDFEKICG